MSRVSLAIRVPTDEPLREESGPRSIRTLSTTHLTTRCNHPDHNCSGLPFQQGASYLMPLFLSLQEPQTTVRNDGR